MIRAGSQRYTRLLLFVWTAANLVNQFENGLDLRYPSGVKSSSLASRLVGAVGSTFTYSVTTFTNTVALSGTVEARLTRMAVGVHTRVETCRFNETRG